MPKDTSSPASDSNRCVQSRRQCGGYSVSRALIFDPDISRQERRSFQFLREQAVDILEVHNEDDFVLWNQLMLQASHRNAAIRFGVLSLVAYYDSLYSPYEASRHAAQAGRHYVNALSAAAGPTSLQHASSTDEVLILSLLLHCIEIFRQQYGDAFIHLQAALRIVRGMSTSEISRSRIATIVDRLKKWPDPKIDAVSLAWSASVPLTSVSTARQRLMQIQNWISRRLYTCIDGQEDIRDPCQGFRLQLLDWKADFDAFCSNTELKANNEAREAIYVRILYGLITLAVATVLAEQSSGPAFSMKGEDAHVMRLLEHCSAFAAIGSHHPDSHADRKTSGGTPIHFGFDIEFVLIVLFLACSTTSHSLRQQAVSLLRSSQRQEGSWDSFHAAHIIECLERFEIEANVSIEKVAYLYDRSSYAHQHSLEFVRPDTVCVDVSNQDLRVSATVVFRCTCTRHALCPSTSLADKNVTSSIKMEDTDVSMIPAYEQTEFTPSVVTQILTASRYRLGAMPTHMGSSVLAVRQQKPDSSCSRSPNNYNTGS